MTEPTNDALEVSPPPAAINTGKQSLQTKPCLKKTGSSTSENANIV